MFLLGFLTIASLSAGFVDLISFLIAGPTRLTFWRIFTLNSLIKIAATKYVL